MSTATPAAVDVSQQPAAAPEAAQAPAPEPAKVEAPADTRPEWQRKRDALRAETPPEPAAEPAKDEPAAEPEAPAEKPPEPVKEEPKPDPKDEALGQLAAKMAAVRRAQADLKKQQAEFRPQVEFATKLRDTVKADPLAALRMVSEAAGVEFHDLYSRATKALVSDLEPPDPAAIATKAAEDAFNRRMEESREAWQKQKAEQEAQQRQETIRTQFQESVQQISTELSTGNWPLLSLRDQQVVAKAAIDEAAREYAATQQVLDYSVALDRLESRLQAQAEKDYQAAQRKLGQGAQKPGAAPANAAPQVSTPTGQQDPRPRTLAQSHAQDGGPPKAIDWREKRRRFREGG